MSLYPKNALLLAPLAGYTDLPFRRAARRCGCNFAFTEMIDASALVYARKRTEHMLSRACDEGFLGVQVVSNNPEHLKIAVEILNGYDFQVLDFNLGCPVPKVVKKGAGAALGKNSTRALELFKIIADKSKMPVSVKLRITEFGHAENTVELVDNLSKNGAAAVTIHGRVAAAFYSGAVDFATISQVQSAVSIPIIANGGIFGYHSYQEAKRNCIAHGFMIARGAMGNPWIFREIELGEKFTPPTIDDLIEMAREHVLDILDFYGEEKGICVSRKIILDYFQGRGFRGEWRNSAVKINSKQEFLQHLATAKAAHSSDYWKNLSTHPEAERRIAEH